jgi:hypothetical protein
VKIAGDLDVKMRHDAPRIGKEKASQPFRLRIVTFKGQGISAELRDAGFMRFRDLHTRAEADDYAVVLLSLSRVGRLGSGGHRVSM